MEGTALVSPAPPCTEELVLPSFKSPSSPSEASGAISSCPSPGHPMMEGTCTVPSPRGQWWAFMALHKATCGWEPPLISHVGLSNAWSQAI